MLFISSLHYYHKVDMFSDIIVLVPSIPFQTYDITSCDCGHVLLHCLSENKKKTKIKQKIKKRKIKSKKIDKKKRKLKQNIQV